MSSIPSSSLLRATYSGSDLLGTSAWSAKKYIQSTRETPGTSRSVNFARQSVPIIAFCHLSWDWVWQRPQQFLSRLAKRHRILFVETYCSDVEEAAVKLRTEENQFSVTILQMHLPRARWHDGAFIDVERRRLLKKALAENLSGQFENPVLWFNDPMAVVSFAGQLDESAIVYDCMDELSQFKNPPPALLERERKLLACADVVFCGGRKMRDKRLPFNSNSYFYGTGVDCDHFGKALSKHHPVSPDLIKLNGPVLGYFGVVDERLDYELIDKLAAANSKWHVVIIGPAAKVDPSGFPKRPNLHWLGGRPYAELPSFTKGFSVCLMPFALNAATEYINPTKALEYMASGRPVVSTALDEVRSNFNTVARIAESHEEFISFCEREVKSPSRLRINRGLKLAAENTWEAIVEKLEGHVQEVLATPSSPVAYPQNSQRTAAYV